jgi:hypothetical protein
MCLHHSIFLNPQQDPVLWIDLLLRVGDVFSAIYFSLFAFEH